MGTFRSCSERKRFVTNNELKFEILSFIAIVTGSNQLSHKKIHFLKIFMPESVCIWRPLAAVKHDLWNGKPQIQHDKCCDYYINLQMTRGVLCCKKPRPANRCRLFPYGPKKQQHWNKMALLVKYIIIVTGDTLVQGGGSSQPATCAIKRPNYNDTTSRTAKLVFIWP